MAVSASGQQLVMKGVTEAAAFIDGMHHMARLNLLAHPSHQAGGVETHGGLGVLMIVLDGDGDLAQVHVQTEFKDGFDLGIVLGRDLCCVVHTMIGLIGFSHTLRRVPVLPTLVNPSWHLTPTAP